MRPIIYYFIFLSFLSVTCKKKDRPDIPQPIKELTQTFSDCGCQPFIDQYKWRNQTIYLSSCNGPTCNCVIWYYDQEGKRIEMAAGYSHDDFRKESTRIKNVWTCK